MGIQLPLEVATDSRFREVAGWGDPPRAGVVKALEPSGQVRVDMDDPDGGDVLAWPLNGFTYAVGAVVYVAFAANSPDGGVVLGSKAPLPTLDGIVTAHDHAGYVARDGSTPLTGDWDMGDGRKLSGDKVAARDGAGLRLEDDGGNLGVFVKDGGAVGVANAAPDAPLHVGDTGGADGEILVQSNGGRTAVLEADDSGNYVHVGSHSNHDFYVVRNNVPKIEVAATYTRLTDALGILGVTPQGALHAHDGVGGVLFVTKTGVGATAVTILPNAAGDVTHGLAGLAVVSDGTYAAAGSLTLFPGGSEDISAGTLAVRLACAADGSLTVKRQSGTGTATVALLAVWV